MSLAFNEHQFMSFMQYLKQEAGADLPIRTAACTIGLQKCGNIWVLGKDLHIDVMGNEIDDREKKYLWFDRGIIGEIGNVSTADLLPNIQLPLTTNYLPHLVKLLKVALKHNFYSSLLVLAGGVMSLHYSSIVTEYSGCPIIVATGEAETGKSTAITASLCMLGISCLDKNSTLHY